MVAWAPPYSVMQSVRAPERQMVVVPTTSTSATTAIARVSFTVLLYGERGDERERFRWVMRVMPPLAADEGRAEPQPKAKMHEGSLGQTRMVLNAVYGPAP